MSSTIVRLCVRCGRQASEHDVSRPADRDPVRWDRFVGGACSQAESWERLEDALAVGVNVRAMLAAQRARHEGRRLA